MITDKKHLHLWCILSVNTNSEIAVKFEVLFLEVLLSEKRIPSAAATLESSDLLLLHLNDTHN